MENTPDTSRYDKDFFAFVSRTARMSAETVVPIVMDLFPVERVVDVGCGMGTWLSVFKEHGVNSILGIDGEYVDESSLQIEHASFRKHDLQHPIQLTERFDLALCLEVGEHLPHKSAGTLIDTLVKLSDTIFFSAAIPGQRGDDHINEQWPDYWAEMFSSHGYVPFDILRGKIWSDQNVSVWYRQNLLLFVGPKSPCYEAAISARSKDTVFPLSIVHPEYFMSLNNSLAVSLTRNTPPILRSLVSKIVRPLFRPTP